nr:PREDICTED: uncharacterized protein LOC105675656 [Linepithema humile]
MLLGYIKYVCGMFSIASYRIEQAMMSNMLRNSTFRKNIMISKKISNASDNICFFRFCDSLVSTFKGMFFLLIFTAVSCLSLSLYGVVSHVDNIPELWLHFTGVIALFISMFLAHYAAQDIIDHNDNVFITVYNVNWYMAPLHIQKMILFLLQRGTKTFNMTIGGLFIGSLESAATMASASVSYFTVLYSMRQ